MSRFTAGIRRFASIAALAGLSCVGTAVLSALHADHHVEHHGDDCNTCHMLAAAAKAALPQADESIHFSRCEEPAPPALVERAPDGATRPLPFARGPPRAT